MFFRKLSPSEKALLEQIASGATLKSHRELDGSKRYRLYAVGAEGAEPVEYELVQRLLRKKLITTNQKFPAATFLLTNRGRAAIGKDRDDLRGIGGVVNFDK